MKLQSLSLVLLAFVSPCVASSIAITTTSLPNGTVQTAYSASIKASGGCTPYSWAVSGSLPAGVTKKVSSTTTSLTFSGTPTTAATYSFTVAATGCGKKVSQKSYTVAIQKSANHVVDLSWKASTSTNIAGYNVYRSPDSSTWKRVNSGLTASTQYSDSTVSNGSTYYYATSAVDITGKESSKTTAVKVTIP